MTYEEAHKFLEIKQREMTIKRHLYNEQAIEINGLAIEALEKQIPRKPVEQGDGINYNCPVCGRYVGYIDAMAWEMPKYCDECGQMIDWSDKT